MSRSVLVDARRGIGEQEEELIDWLADMEMPVVITLTKADKLSKSKLKPIRNQTKQSLGLPYSPLVTSAAKGEGLTELWRAIFELVAD